MFKVKNTKRNFYELPKPKGKMEPREKHMWWCELLVYMEKALILIIV